MKIKFLSPIVLFGLLFPQLYTRSSYPAQASTLPSKPPQTFDKDSLDYKKALVSIEKTSLKNEKITSKEFQSFSWSGKTALLNYACSTLPAEDCRNILSLGLEDKALVIRDHSLKIVLNSQMFLPEEKLSVAKSVVEDQRNYRNHYPLWIISHAISYISAHAEKNTSQD